MSNNLTPLEVCVELVAPLKDLGEIAGYHAKGIYHWRNPSSWRDAGDLPPRAMRTILAHARKNGLPLTERHLIWGATQQEIDELRHGQLAAQ